MILTRCNNCPDDKKEKHEYIQPGSKTCMKCKDFIKKTLFLTAPWNEYAVLCKRVVTKDEIERFNNEIYDKYTIKGSNE